MTTSDDLLLLFDLLHIVILLFLEKISHSFNLKLVELNEDVSCRLVSMVGESVWG